MCILHSKINQLPQNGMVLLYHSTSFLRPPTSSCLDMVDSGLNGKPVCHISFRLGRNDEICKEYLSTSY